MKYLITFLFLLFSIIMFSQQEIIYDLDSYRQVNFKRSALVLTPTGGVSGIDNINIADSDADFLFKIGADADHNRDFNSESEQYTLRQNINFNIAQGIELSAKRKVTKRSYSGNKYLKLGYEGEGSFDTRRNQSTNIKNDYKNLNFSGDFGLGFGRIEFVNHAWSAVQILQALKKNGLLLRVPSHDEITEFADLVGTVRTNRILDFRLRNIEILETTINYLIEEKLINQLSTLAILIIGDTYQYDQIISRNAGSRLEFTLTPSTHFSKNNTVPVQSLSPNETLTLQTTGGVDHVSYNNIDIKWMKTRSYGARIEFSNKYEYYADILLENRTTKTGTAGLTYNYGYRYLPNLRNNFNLNLETGILMVATFKENQSTTYSNARLLIRLHTAFNHYFSPSTQFNVNGGLVYYDSQFQGGDFQPEINGYLDFAINHAIF